jgi:hypothetical protein
VSGYLLLLEWKKNVKIFVSVKYSTNEEMMEGELWHTCWRACMKELVLITSQFNRDSINLGEFGMIGRILCTTYRM